MWRRIFMGRVQPGNLDSPPITWFQCEICFNLFPHKTPHECKGSDSRSEVGDEVSEIYLA